MLTIKERQAELKKQLAESQSQNTELQNTQTQLQNKIKSLQNMLARLRKNASDPIRIADENEQLKQQPLPHHQITHKYHDRSSQ